MPNCKKHSWGWAQGPYRPQKTTKWHAEVHGLITNFIKQETTAVKKTTGTTTIFWPKVNLNWECTAETSGGTFVRVTPGTSPSGVYTMLIRKKNVRNVSVDIVWWTDFWRPHTMQTNAWNGVFRVFWLPGIFKCCLFNLDCYYTSKHYRPINYVGLCAHDNTNSNTIWQLGEKHELVNSRQIRKICVQNWYRLSV